jgi:hypothetical protein
MRRHITKALGVAAATIALATTAQAQGRGRDRDHDRDRDRREHRDDGDWRRDRDHRGRDRDGATAEHRANGDIWRVPQNRRVPPGLAKKPGQMPPGQFKKHYYTPYQGATTLGGFLRRGGYRVDRIGSAGDSRLVYYRGPDGILRRAIVSPGADRLGFSNVPSSLLQQVMSALYGY